MPEDKRNSRLNAGIFADVPAFVRGLTFADLPADVVEQARRCLLDLIGVAAAGSRTRAAQIVNDYAATQLRSSEMEARMLFDGQRRKSCRRRIRRRDDDRFLRCARRTCADQGSRGRRRAASGTACDDREFRTDRCASGDTRHVTADSSRSSTIAARTSGAP
jgi:hypothetical protein